MEWSEIPASDGKLLKRFRKTNDGRRLARNSFSIILHSVAEQSCIMNGNTWYPFVFSKAQHHHDVEAKQIVRSANWWTSEWPPLSMILLILQATHPNFTVPWIQVEPIISPRTIFYSSDNTAKLNMNTTNTNPSPYFHEIISPTHFSSAAPLLTISSQ